MNRFLLNLCLVTLHVCSNSVGANPVDGETLFDSSKLLEFDMPLSCEGESFCFDMGDQYPEEDIEKLLNQQPKLAFKERIDPTLTFRDGGNDNPDCPTNDTFVDKPIYYILDENEKVRAVVQSPEKFQQLYSAKWCARPGLISYDTPHFMKGSATLENFKIKCENMYLNFDFLVLSDKGEVEIARPKGGIPVCCRCSYSSPV